MNKIVALGVSIGGFIKELFAKKEPKKAPVIAPIAPEKIVVHIGDGAHITGFTGPLEGEFDPREVVDALNWSCEIEGNFIQQEHWERLIRKPNRINKKLSYRKKKSQAKNWDKWKRKGVN